MKRREQAAVVLASLMGIGVLAVVTFVLATPHRRKPQEAALGESLAIPHWRKLQEAALGEGRRGHSMILLPDKTVLIVGGGNLIQEDERPFRGVMVRACEIYDPTSTTCSMTGSRIYPDEPAAYIALHDGRVLAIGEGPTRPHCEIYDPRLGTWKDTASVLLPRYGFETALLANGEVMIAGGKIDRELSSACELFNPTLGTWRKAAPMLSPRLLHRIVSLRDGRALVMGSGRDPHDCEVFDLKVNCWTRSAPLLDDHGSTFIAVELQDGRVLVAGGAVYHRGGCVLESVPAMTSEIFDPATNRWSAAGRLPIAIDLRLISTHLLDNGNLVVIGVNFGKKCLLYDSKWNVWRLIPTLHTPRYDHASVKLSDGRILVSGGYKGGTGVESLLQDFEVLK